MKPKRILKSDQWGDWTPTEVSRSRKHVNFQQLFLPLKDDTGQDVFAPRRYTGEWKMFLQCKGVALPEHVWISERIRHASLMLRECLEIDPEIRGGIPVLRGTRFTVAQVFAELAEGRSVTEIAEAFRLDEEQLKKVLDGFAIYLDRSSFHEEDRSSLYDDFPVRQMLR